MSITLIIILIVAASLVMGPIMMMRPNPAQKNKENMRLRARAKGVHYAMRNLPRQADEQEQPAAIPVYFIPPTKTQVSAGWMLARTHYEHGMHFLGWWAWQSDMRPTTTELAVLEARLKELPESVRALSAGGNGVCVYWEEKGGELVLERLIEFLEALKQAAINPE
jgi:hypothetical protein